MSEKQHVAELMDGYLKGTLSPAEKRAFFQLFDQDTIDPQLEQLIIETYEQGRETTVWPEDFRKIFAAALAQKIFAKRELEPDTLSDVSTDQETPADKSYIAKPVHLVHFLRRWGWAAAAMLVIGTTVVFVVSSTRQSNQPETVFSPKSAASDILPGSNKALLTLSDGKTITLDSAANGAIAKQGSSSIIKLANGEIVYNPEGNAQGEVMMNTMATPCGGQYQVTLPDGTKVWLNAASSIIYPAAFVGKERQVKIQGEAYFEVANDKQKPFIVDIDGKSSVEVLGTSFNVSAYQDENAVRTTLISGSVKVISSKAAILKPGQQADIPRSDPGFINIQPADLSQTLAWKNGIFDFTGADLRSVMKQLERWYDIKVQYKGAVSNMTFDGKMYRNVNLSEVLAMLKKMGVKFELEGKNLMVL